MFSLCTLILISMILAPCLVMAADETCMDSSAIRSSNSRIIESIYAPSCVYYLAPSSIPNAGFGTYTIKDINNHEPLMNQADAPTITVSNYVDHNNINPKRKDTIPLAVHHNYFTDGFDVSSFEVDGETYESVVNFAFVNHHSFLVNMHHSHQEFDDSITSRASASAGIGAYSYNEGYNFITTRDVNAGEELFFDHGDNWLDVRDHCENIPRSNDYIIGASMIERVIMSGIKSSELNVKLVAFIHQVASMCQDFSPKALSLSLDDIAYVLDLYSTNSSSSPQTVRPDQHTIATALAKRQLIPRTIDWIMSEGKCLDNLIPDISTLRDAGRGAFAQRYISKGSIVVPAPVLQIADASELNMYNFETNERIGTQLLMNYCFSHPYTALLFCPQTNAILINHCSNRSVAFGYGGDCDRYNKSQDVSSRGPNAYVRWATAWDPDTENTLKMSIDEFHINTQKGRRLLTMEVIASRDIHPGDEVFIDYGEDWEKAWEDHVRNWKPPSVNNYVPVKTMNENVVDLKTPDELDSEPYPDNVRIGCRYDEHDDEFEDMNVGKVWDDYDDPMWLSSGDEFLEAVGEGNFWPCSVLGRVKGGHDGIYSVEIFQSKSMPITQWTELGVRRVIKRFPRQSIKFQPMSGSTDHYLPGVFRQPIGLPHSMMVEHWMIM